MFYGYIIKSLTINYNLKQDVTLFPLHCTTITSNKRSIYYTYILVLRTKTKSRILLCNNTKEK